MNGKSLERAYLAGLIIPVWLLLGVTLVGALTPGYSHLDHAMSLLGAQGAPGYHYSPLINNYPLGVLFILFGAAVYASFRQSTLARASGVLIALHGLASFCTGYFACDAGCAPAVPSTSQNLHNWAGLVMFASLLLANLLWVYLARRLLQRKRFALFSLVCAVVSLAALPLMGQALQDGEGFGLYQRFNYGAAVVWVAGLAMVLRARVRHAGSQVGSSAER